MQGPMDDGTCSTGIWKEILLIVAIMETFINNMNGKSVIYSWTP